MKLLNLHTGVWLSDWKMLILEEKKNQTGLHTNSINPLLCQPCAKRARRETKAEEYERYLQTAESALKALQAIERSEHSPSPPQWVRARLQLLQTLITQINTTAEEQSWFNYKNTSTSWLHYFISLRLFTQNVCIKVYMGKRSLQRPGSFMLNVIKIECFVNFC